MPNNFDRRSFLRSATCGGLAILTNGCLCGPQPVTASQTPESLKARSSLPPDMIIDTHIHVVHGNPNLKPIPEAMDRLMSAPAPDKARQLSLEMQQARVGIALGMGQRNGGPDDPLGI